MKRYRRRPRRSGSDRPRSGRSNTRRRARCFAVRRWSFDSIARRALLPGCSPADPKVGIYVVLLRESLSRENTPFAKLIREVGSIPWRSPVRQSPRSRPRSIRQRSGTTARTATQSGRAAPSGRSVPQRHAGHRTRQKVRLSSSDGQRALAARGCDERSTLKMTPRMVTQAAKLYGDGLSTVQIGMKLGVTASTVGKALKRAGAKLRPPVENRWN